MSSADNINNNDNPVKLPRKRSRLNRFFLAAAVLAVIVVAGVIIFIFLTARTPHMPTLKTPGTGLQPPIPPPPPRVSPWKDGKTPGFSFLGKRVPYTEDFSPPPIGTVIPRLRKSVPAVYPPEALKQKIAGTVHVVVITDIHGNVAGAKVFRGHPLLRQAALDAAKKFKYEPFMVDGYPRPVKLMVTFRFGCK